MPHLLLAVRGQVHGAQHIKAGERLDDRGTSGVGGDDMPEDGLTDVNTQPIQGKDRRPRIPLVNQQDVPKPGGEPRPLLLAQDRCGDGVSHDRQTEFELVRLARKPRRFFEGREGLLDRSFGGIDHKLDRFAHAVSTAEVMDELGGVNLARRPRDGAPE